MAAVLAVVAGLTGLVVVRRRLRRATLPARAVIVSPRKSTSIAHDGAVSSVQSAELTIPTDDLDRLWSPANLENLGRTYWSFLTRVTLGLIRVHYGEASRSICLLVRPLTLLRFELPDYEFDAEHGKITWLIRDGLLVTRAGRGSGHLQVEVRRLESPTPGEAKLLIEVDVSNFYPAIAAGFSTPVYEGTQSFLHVLVTHAFLRSLATLELVESKVGKLAVPPEGLSGEDADGPPPEPPRGSDRAISGQAASDQP
jgi:hypothetical protein